MICISLYEHPFACVQPQVFQAKDLTAWLLQHYGATPSVKVQIFVGQPSAETEITDNVPEILASSAPAYTVLQSPAGVDPVTWFVIGLVFAVAATYLLTPKPEMPNAAINRSQASPNNALAGRDNKVRMLERVEDIYGTVKSIPSLMMPTYNKYIDHQKYEFGYYCISRGYCSVTALKDGDTLVSDITGAGAAVYHPFTSPNSGSPVLQVGTPITDEVITAARAVEVDGITLKALNQVQPSAGSFTFTSAGVITQSSKNPNFSSVVTVLDSVTVNMTPTVVTSAAGSITVVAAAKTFADNAAAGLFNAVKVGDTMTTSGFTSAGNNGTWTVTAKTAYLITVSATPVNETAAAARVAVTRNYSGTYPVTAVGDGTITVTATGWPVSATVSCTIPIVGVTEYTSWVTLPGAERTEVWCNITAPNGMFKDNGGKSTATVAFSIEIEQLNPTTLAPTGTVETVTGQLSGAVTDERAITVEHATAWTGPARVRIRRTTPFDFGFNGTVMDEIKWADLYSVTPVSKTHFGNKTTVHTVTQATARATAVKTRQLNCIASRLLPTFDGTGFSATLDATGLKTSGTLYATSKLVDIIAAVAIDPKIGARDLATDVDLAQIYATQQALDAWSPLCGQFNYTFDTDNTSFEETLVTIANAGFCIAYRQSGRIRLAFDRAQTASTALFTHRNKKPRSETITRTFASDSDYDGVQFVYVDPDSDTSETITLPLDGSATKLKKFEIAGIRNFDQAWYRACREYAKLRGQRITLETTTTLDARSLLPNARIDVVDNTRFKSFDGDVVGQSGLEITLSRDVEFAPGLPHSVVLMKRDGSLQSIACTAGSAPNRVILSSLPGEAIVTDSGPDGIRTIFSFAADSARSAMAYLVQEIDITDGQYVNLRAINYSADYYTADTAPVPAKASIIY